jgi:hypothetical protein
MTIAQYLPQWLRSRWPKPVPQKDRRLSKKDRQVIPAVPKPERSPARPQNDDSSERFRIYWRM